MSSLTKYFGQDFKRGSLRCRFGRRTADESGDDRAAAVILPHIGSAGEFGGQRSDRSGGFGPTAVKVSGNVIDEVVVINADAQNRNAVNSKMLGNLNM